MLQVPEETVHKGDNSFPFAKDIMYNERQELCV